jgi:hypothetical protein
MTPEAGPGEKRRGSRRGWWIAGTLLLLPAALFVGSNLALDSPWGCRWIAGKLAARTGLEARVGGAGWSPWNGVTLHSLALLQVPELRSMVPDPLLEIRKINLAPVWRAWLRGRPEIQSISLDSPRMVLPIELISHLAKPPSVPAPAPAMPPPAMPPPAAPTAPSHLPPAAPAEAAKQAPPPPQAPPQPTGWLHVKNASLAIVHASTGKRPFDLSAMNGSIPIAGAPARTALRIGRISASGHELTRELSASLDWSPPRLSLSPLDLEILGYSCKLAGQIGMFRHLPIAIEAQVPKQVLKPVRLPWNGQAAADGMAANARFRGFLFAPGTWQGELVAEFSVPTIRIADQEARFDRGSSVTVLRGGALSCVDVRLIGDPLSLLGNATLIADGRLAGAARVVAAPDAAGAIASRLFPTVPGQRPLTALSTPQRAAFDLEVMGNLRQIFLSLGKSGPIIQFNP